jgi:hypothetical protein
MSNNWGPNFIVPTAVIGKYSGIVMLRETLDRDLLASELAELGLPQQVVRITNPWYYRRLGDDTWRKIGESTDEKQNFSVTWDTTKLQNGQYEILGLMHVFVKDAVCEGTIARQNIVQITVENAIQLGPGCN